MKNLLTKRLISVIIALALCISAAGVSSAVESNAATTRVITVDTNDIVNESYKGVGSNHWTSPYLYGMNDAYQLVNEKRNNMQQLKYVRMMFLPNWIIDTSLPEEQQKWEWENGIYHFDSIEAQNFFRKIKMYKDSGTQVLLNFGGRITYDIASWWQIKDAAVTAGSTRAAPANLEAFADATYAILEYSWNQGYDNVNMLSFYNEVNGFNYETFYDKKIYWVRMLKEVHYELASHTYTGNPASEHYGKNVRDEVFMFGSEFAAWSDSDGITEFLDYIVENLVDENGEPIYDALNTHLYPNSRTYDTVIKDLEDFNAKYPIMWANEYGHRTFSDAGEDYFGNYKSSELMMQIAFSNSGYGGAANWVVSADTAPDPMNVSFFNGFLAMWNYPSIDMDEISHIYGLRMLYTRYIPADCKVYKSAVNSDDIICAVYGLEDDNDNITDMTVVLDVEESNQSRELKVNLGSKAANKTFKRMVYYFPEKNEEGYEFMETPYEFGDLMPYSDKVLKADQNGNIVDTLPTDKHCAIVYTTMDEQVQIVTDVNKVNLEAGKSQDFDVTAIYGTDDNDNLNNVTWEIYGKSRTDTNGGYNLTTENCGTIDQNGNYDSTGTVKGDTVAIKITSNYDPTAYTVIIVEIV
ncbi:MAG: hypothetical protein IJZ75_03595 [Clostridia bacterium]|nr:hypothetical protein [Clostridia bacterium]